MIPIHGQPVLTAAAMRAAEQAVMTQGVSEATLMDRAGRTIARAVARLAAGREILVLCGPGNNGGDGYIAAARLLEQGQAVRVAALAEPRSEGCRRAAELWGGPVASLDEVEPAPILVDALFGTVCHVDWSQWQSKTSPGSRRRHGSASPWICPAASPRIRVGC